MLTDESRFDQLVDNILDACGGTRVDKPKLAEVLLTQNSQACSDK